MKIKVYVSDEAISDTLKIKDFVIRKNDTFVFDLYFRDEEDVAVNLTSATVFLTVKEKISDADASAKISKTITAITDALNGESSITLATTDTAITVGNYIYDIAVKLSTGKIYTVLMGRICIQSDVTIRTA